MAVLLSTQETSPMPNTESEVKISTPKSPAGYYSTRFVLPRSLLVLLDEPARIAITGTPHEGFIVEATRSKESGTYALNYKTSGRVVKITGAFKPMKLSKAVRKVVALHARVRDGKIHIAGPPLEWIQGKEPWVEGGPVLIRSHMRLPAKAASGAMQVNGAELGNGSPTAPVAKVAPGVTDKDLMTRLAVALRTAASLKAELEKRKGLKLRLTRDLHVVLDLE